MEITLKVPHYPGVRLVFGSMMFASQVNEKDAIAQLKTFYDFHQSDEYVEIDTAYLYGDTKTEAMLGKILTAEQKSRLRIATKGADLNNRFLTYIYQN